MLKASEIGKNLILETFNFEKIGILIRPIKIVRALNLEAYKFNS